MTATTFDGLARRILRRRPRLGNTRLVAVDGPSGAGKTVFATRLAASVAAVDGGVAPPVVHTDDFLDGWDDQFTGWERIDELLLAPLRSGRPGRHRRYDWALGAFVGPWVPVPAAPVVVLEGFGAMRAGPEVTFAVFVTAPDRLRLQRSLDRDGADTRPELLRWRRRENRHFAADRTAERADLVVSGVWTEEPILLDR
jgi:uridine kinase